MKFLWLVREDFGGVSIIAIGDLFQLQPVMDGYIYKDVENSEYGVLATNLWQQHFKIFERHVIVRQRESKTFAQVLNKLREGNHPIEDLWKLKERLTKEHSLSYPSDAPHLFIQNAKVNNLNMEVHNASDNEKYNIKAQDSVIGTNSLQLKKKNLNQIPSDPRKQNSYFLILNWVKVKEWK